MVTAIKSSASRRWANDSFPCLTGNSIHLLLPVVFFNPVQKVTQKVRTLRMFLPRHEGQDGFSVVIGLLFTGRTGVLAIISQFIHPAQVTDGVAEGKADGRSTAGY